MSDEPRTQWVRLVLDITDQIRRGELKPGDRLPTATALGEQRGLSKGTVQRAVAELQRQGLLRGEPGRAVTVTDVAPPPADADRLAALEARVAELERWRAEQGQDSRE